MLRNDMVLAINRSVIGSAVRVLGVHTFLFNLHSQVNTLDSPAGGIGHRRLGEIVHQFFGICVISSSSAVPDVLCIFSNFKV